MSKSAKPLDVGETLEKFKELIYIFDELIKNDIGNNSRTYKEVRDGINNSRLKFIYQLNVGNRLASDIDIFTPEALEELRQAILRAKKDERGE